MPKLETGPLKFGKFSGEIALIVVTVTYLVAVSQRSSLGVAALEAAHRFEVNAATLSALGVVQLAVYALMQVPVGVLLDKYGAKASLVFGAIVMFAGQLIVATSASFELAVAGRMLVGFGDAFTFIALIRIINSWFTGTRASLYQQLSANLGQLGQVLSAIPFHFLLESVGWTPAFATLASMSLVVSLLSLAFITEGVTHHRGSVKLQTALKQLKTNLADPAAQMAFWVHFTLQSSGSSFILLWGFPFLVKAQHLPAAQASFLLTSFVFIGFLVGPIIVTLGGRFPEHRSTIVFTVAALIIAAWLFVVINPAPAPFWLLLIFVLIIASGGPASMMAFDYSRRYIPMSRIGSANGIINMGGFVAAFSLMFLVGFGLDLSVSLNVADSTYSLESFRIAFLAEIVVTATGLLAFARAGGKLKKKLAARE